jgi:hypothetical protein
MLAKWSAILGNSSDSLGVHRTIILRMARTNSEQVGAEHRKLKTGPEGSKLKFEAEVQN